jgi:hypothetical protein
VVSNSSSAISRRLTDLTRAHPADRTLENLLRALTAKLDLCARLPVYEYEAATEGHPSTATAFESLAAVERESFDQLLRCLSGYLAESAPKSKEADGCSS